MDLRKCLTEAVKDRDYCQELADTLIEDIEKISSVHESELATLWAKLDRMGSAPPGIEAKCVQLRSQVTGLEDELADLTQRFAVLDRTQDEERATLESSRDEAASKADGLALKLVQAKAYIHSTLSMEYGREGNKPSEPQLAFRRLQTELVEKEEALRVTTAKVGTLRALLETKRICSISDSMMVRELVYLQHSHDRLKEIARDIGFDAAELLRTHAHDDLFLRTGFGRLCQVVSDRLGYI